MGDDERPGESTGDNRPDERARLIGAAWTVLERSGYEGFKVQLLLRETGLSARTFYRHFSDKDELFLALMADEYARVGRLVGAQIAHATAPDERVAAWVRAIVLAAGDPRRAARARLFTSQPAVLLRFPEQLSRAAQAVLDPLVQAITAGHDAGLFPLADPARDPALIHDLAGAAMSTALAHPSDVETIADSVADFVLRALGMAGPVRRAERSRGGRAPRSSPG